RIAGFQVGASFTPDSGKQGASFGERDDDGDFENVVALAANYVANYNGLSVVLSIFGEFGDGEPDTSSPGNSTGGTSVGDVETHGIGATIGYGGATLGAGYVDLNEAGIPSVRQALGEDAGRWWNVGAGYTSGPWGVSVGYYEATLGNVSGLSDTENSVVSIDADYAVAPGWNVTGSLNFIDAENIGRTLADNSDQNNGHVLILYNRFNF
ncbi:MAG: porin, partial [Alphaproteobacteria bacterium]|nr:porin [Alphaproteobacteria bacterium]